MSTCRHQALYVLPPDVIFGVKEQWGPGGERNKYFVLGIWSMTVDNRILVAALRSLMALNEWRGPGIRDILDAGHVTARCPRLGHHKGFLSEIPRLISPHPCWCDGKPSTSEF